MEVLVILLVGHMSTPYFQQRYDMELSFQAHSRALLFCVIECINIETRRTCRRGL